MSTPDAENQTTQKSSHVPFLSLVLIAVIFFVATAKPAGYCKAQKREIPDEEICIKLIDDAIKYGLVQLQPNESSGQAFYLNHRSSCSVDKSAMARFRQSGLVDALFSDTIYAGISYKMSENFKKNRSIHGDKINSELVELSPCMEVRKSYGLVE